MAKSNKSIGSIIITLALAIMLIVMGTQAFTSAGNGKSGFGGRLTSGVNALVNGDEVTLAVHNLLNDNKNHGLVVTVVIIVGILEVAAGLLVLLNFFLPIGMGKTKKLLMWIVFGIWCVVLVLVDVLGSNGITGDAFKNGTHTLAWLKSLSVHLLILGAILVAKDN